MIFHGEKLPSKFDRMFRYLASGDWADRTIGEVDSPDGHISVIKYNGHAEEMVVDLKAAKFGSGELMQIKLLKGGTYVVVEDSNGLVWVFFYNFAARATGVLKNDLLDAEFRYDTWAEAEHQ